MATHPMFSVIQFRRVAGTMNSRKAITFSVTAVHAKGTRVLCSPRPWNQ